LREELVKDLVAGGCETFVVYTERPVTIPACVPLLPPLSPLVHLISQRRLEKPVAWLNLPWDLGRDLFWISSIAWFALLEPQADRGEEFVLLLLNPGKTIYTGWW